MADLILGGEDNRHVWMPVTVKVAVNGGKNKIIRFDAELVDVGQKRSSEIFEAKMDDEDLLNEVLVGWRKITGISLDGGAEISYDNDETREAFLGFTGVAGAIAGVWIDMVQANKGRRKNY